ncbi:hypothetical protein RF11_00094 [Thelohanellus kitauei]|uniref:Uncharacterized protein n=1 Tax=Thelohanellus kitauei TaxID=669202 RepID=A0A0C2N1K1_THEKT|nr:hypothetical protein RF11_00094 [Thelohanellus kitauei]
MEVTIFYPIIDDKCCNNDVLVEWRQMLTNGTHPVQFDQIIGESLEHGARYGFFDNLAKVGNFNPVSRFGQIHHEYPPLDSGFLRLSETKIWPIEPLFWHRVGSSCLKRSVEELIEEAEEGCVCVYISVFILV